ncbi:MAG: TcfC E-set like domain-containing protein [Sphingomonadaceae bacterium]|nr:TcfC E-set like domain-containing protein [Sphingomonadaceae bacterium]
MRPSLAWIIRSALVIGALVLAFAAQAKEPQRLAAADFSVAAPDGFEDLATPHRALVEIFFLGQSLGVVTAHIAPGELSFENPESVFARFAPYSDADDLKAFIARGNIPTNSDRICSAFRRAEACRFTVEDAPAVVFDPDLMRLDFYVPPSLLKEPDWSTPAYLEPDDARLMVINGVAFVASGGEGQKDLLSVSDKLIISAGPARLRGDLGYATDLGLQVDQLLVEAEHRNLRFQAGAMWSPGTTLLSRRKLWGGAIGTQNDTNMNRALSEGTPLIVFLERRARVDILRDGKILSSATYPAGNQQIDTSSLPEGSYQLDLRIHDTQGQTRNEQRFFTKYPRLPVRGIDRFEIAAGLEIESTNPGALAPAGDPFVYGSYARRISNDLALDVSGVLRNDQLMLEAGGYWLTPIAVVRLAAVASPDNAFGGVIQAQSSADSPVSFSFDLRKVQNIDGNTRYFEAANRNLASSVPAASLPSRQRSSFTQASGSLSWGNRNLQLAITGILTRRSGEPASYSIGPNARLRVLEDSRFRLFLDASATTTERGTNGFVGIQLLMTGKRSAVGLRSGYNFESSNTIDQRKGPYAAINANWQESGVLGGDLNLGAYASTERSRETASASADLRTQPFRLTGELGNQSVNGVSSKSYSLGARTALIAGSGDLRINSNLRGESAIVVVIEGGRAQDRFDLLLDHKVIGELVSGQSLTIPLPAYRRYSLRVRPRSAKLVAYDGGARTITLFPGQVSRQAWQVEPLSIILGRLLDRDGVPIAGASLEASGSIAMSDEQGYFQIEAPPGALVTVVSRDGRRSLLQLPPNGSDAAIVRLGAVTLDPQPGEIRLGSASDVMSPLTQGFQQ